MPGAIGSRRKSMYDEEPCPEKSLVLIQSR